MVLSNDVLSTYLARVWISHWKKNTDTSIRLLEKAVSGQTWKYRNIAVEITYTRNIWARGFVSKVVNNVKKHDTSAKVTYVSFVAYVRDNMHWLKIRICLAH